MSSNISDGALISLCASGLMNHRANIKSVAYDYKTFYNSNTSTIEIDRCCDIIIPEYLEFIMNSNYSKEQFISELKKTTLTLTIYNQNEIKFPLDLLVNLSEPIYCDNKIYVNTHFDIFFGNIPFISIPKKLDDVVSFSLINYNNLSQFIQRFGLMSKLSYLDTEDRNILLRTNFIKVFQELSYIKFNMKNILTDNNTYKFNVDFESVSKGFFIESNNINNLSEIKLTLQGKDRFLLNKFLIQKKCVKINNNMIYFPFNYDKSYTDTSSESYEGGINFSRIDSSRLILKFNEPINNIKIYNLGSKIFEKTEKTIEIRDSNHFNSGERDYNNQPTIKSFSSADFLRNTKSKVM
jgi:hypothetical protein